MPNCFTLTAIGENKPETLNAIDEHICKHFNVPIDDKKYYWGWYNTIGLALAMGKTWNEMFDIFEDDRTLEIVTFLSEHYTPDAWCER